jgi:predicted nuclease with TOPRIM domain
MNSFYELNNRRLSTIRIKLQELTREKTKYNVEKLIQDIEFLQGELGHLSHTIAELNREINAQISTKLNLVRKYFLILKYLSTLFSYLEC